MRRANQRHAAICAEECAELQLTPLQFAALFMIGEVGSVSQNHLGRLTAMDPSTIQGVVQRLAHRKLVRPEADPNDGRVYLWSLTSKGKKLRTTAIPKAFRITERTLEPLDESEREQLMKIMGKLG